jgi:tetratricopeptide (TPR) repeat protein
MYGKTYDLPRKSLAFDLVDIIEAKGIQAAREYFDKNKDSDEFILNENEMNQVGYQLMNEGKVEEAAKVFKWNIDAFPSSFNVYDSYAEAMMNLGKNEQAIAYYKKSLELNPGNQNGIDMLAKLGVAKEGLVKEVVIEDEILKSYEGDYELMPGFVLTIFREGKQMRAQATGQQAIDIFPRAENVFFAKIISAQITFNKGADGKIESLTLLQGGQEIPGKKILK